MNNASDDDLERVAGDLSQIARTYSNASQELEQHVITLEGAVSHVLSSGATQWKGLSSEAFVSAWLERRARLKQASMLMSESASYMTTMARTIEDNVPIIRLSWNLFSRLCPQMSSKHSWTQSRRRRTRFLWR